MGLDEGGDISLIIAAARVSVGITYFCVGFANVNRRLMYFGEATGENEPDDRPIPLVRADKLDALPDGLALD